MRQGGLASADTIIALASGQGRAGVAVVRISGPHACEALRRFAQRLPIPRKAELIVLRAADGTPLDQALALFFPGPRSFTGEDVVEFHLHGSRAVVQKVLQEACGIPGVRPARPGEFTERAFENGKMDLLEVEDLADLIDSETELQRVMAFGPGRSRFRAHLTRWRQDLLAISALIEAQIDFSDEDGVPPGVMSELRARLVQLIDDIGKVLDNRLPAERVREGYQVVIAGPPNAGKSSLLNVLAGRDVAIVSPLAGTTRDVLEVRLDLGGIPVVLRDVAGLRDSEDSIERMGIERAMAAIAVADLVLWLDPVDALTSSLPFDAPAVWRVASKTDLGVGGVTAGQLAISAETGHGIADLIELLRNAADQEFRFGEATIMLNLRQEACLSAAVTALGSGLNRDNGDIELMAEDVRSGLIHFRALIGDVSVEDVLGSIFSRFCIGK